MSVAFRRESDEEHLEPKFEIPVPAGPNLVTARGLRLIAAREAELQAQLEATRDEAVIAALKRDLRYWSTRHITAELAPIATGDRVDLGTKVRVLLNGKPRTFELVGHDEAEPGAGLIAYNAPLSRAMLGAEVGDVLAFGEVSEAIEIVEITVSEDEPAHPQPRKR
ncbi:MAG: GreA/GreB family elongation factor [Croceibacterium sp.]